MSHTGSASTVPSWWICKTARQWDLPSQTLLNTIARAFANTRNRCGLVWRLSQRVQCSPSFCGCSTSGGETCDTGWRTRSHLSPKSRWTPRYSIPFALKVFLQVSSLNWLYRICSVHKLISVCFSLWVHTEKCGIDFFKEEFRGTRTLQLGGALQLKSRNLLLVETAETITLHF